MQRERRNGVRNGIKPDENDEHVFAARIVNYGVVDSHGTSWAPGVFKASLENRLPAAVWSHDWNRPIGKVIEQREAPDGLDVVVKLLDFDKVPDARMAHHVLKEGVFDAFSFGFLRQDEEPDKENRGATRITKALIDEVSPVLVGSVPGTGTLGVRSAGNVNRAVADNILEKVAAGELTYTQALDELSSMRISDQQYEIRALTDTAKSAQKTLQSQIKLLEPQVIQLPDVSFCCNDSIGC